MNIHKQIRERILSKLVKHESRTIGIEIECILYTKENKRMPVNPGKHFAAIDLQNIMNNLIGDNGKYTLEPGGQLEWSSKPYKDLNNLQDAIHGHHNILKDITSKNNLKMITYGVDPLYGPDEVDLIDLLKYQLMNKSMEENGTMGKWMMRCTSSIQVNFDVINAEEMEEMVFVADCLNPIASYLFANSPFKNKELTGNKNIRNIIWENTDNMRCKNLFDHGIFSSKDLINQYINYILTVPSIFQLNRSRSISDCKQTIGKRLQDLHQAGSITKQDIDAALHQIFTNVRIKNLVEIRGADRTPEGYEIAPAAFWTGLLIEKSIRDKILQVVRKWNNNDRQLLNHSALTLNISQTGPDNKSYGYWIQHFSDLALNGLRRRNLNEEKLLDRFIDIVIQKGPFSLQVQEYG